MKQEKIKYFLTEDAFYRIPYQVFIKNVKEVSPGIYAAKIKRYVYYFDDKVFQREKQLVLLREKKRDNNIIFLEIKEE